MRLWFALSLAISLLVAPLVDAAVLHGPAAQHASLSHGGSAHDGHATHGDHKPHGKSGMACEHGTCLAGIAMPEPLADLTAPAPLSAEPAISVQPLLPLVPPPLERPPRLLA